MTYHDDYRIDCAAECCSSDEIAWTETVWSTDRVPLGQRLLLGRIARVTYSQRTEMHTFQIDVSAAYGLRAREVATGKRIRRLAKNVYAGLPRRKPWADESARETAMALQRLDGPVAMAERDAGLMARHRRHRAA